MGPGKAALMHHFFAYLSRMKLIERWSLMRSTQRESVQEHSLQVATTAHALALIKNKFFGGKVSPERVALYAIYHDATEVLTGDMPTPVKYFSPEIRNAYQAIEAHAAGQLLQLLPEELRTDYASLLTIPESEKEAHSIVKAADTLCAYVKCLEEKSAGNKEFSGAEQKIREKVETFRDRPEVEYFLKHFVPSFSLTLDELSRPLQR
jgi:5'-deoxynucleotidase